MFYSCETNTSRTLCAGDSQSSNGEFCSIHRPNEDGHSSVEQQLQIQAFDVIQRNRAILRSILKAVIFCGRQNIALRGHHESKLATDEESKHVCNPGQALLRFGMDAGDQILREHLATAPRNAQYHSPTIQNDLIAAAGQWIQKKSFRKLKMPRS